MCLFVCAVDHGVTEGEPVNEPHCEQENEDQFHDPEPEGQDFPEGFEDGKFNLIP